MNAATRFVTWKGYRISISEPLLSEWQAVDSSTCWEKGRIIASFVEQGGTVEGFVREVGGFTVEHGERLRNVWTRFGSIRNEFPNLRWVHFLIVLEWHDWHSWLLQANRENWGPSQMRMARWEAESSMKGLKL